MKGHSLVVFWWAAHVITLLPSLSNNDGCDIDDPHNGSKDGVHDWAICRVVSQLETKTTVDNTKGDDDATEPDVSIRGRCSHLDFLVVGVVESAQDWLEKCEDKEDDTNYSMRLVDLEMRG